MDLFEKYKDLVVQIASSLDISREQSDDAHQAGYLALLESLKSYDITKGIKIKQVASESILAALDPYITVPYIKNTPKPDIRFSPEMKACIEIYMIHLTDTERHILRCLFGIKYEKKTPANLALIYDTDVEEIEEIKEAALDHLRLIFFVQP